MNNTISEEINELKEICCKLSELYGDSSSRFYPPASKTDIEKWENEYTALPEHIRQWLEFSDGYEIMNDRLFHLDDFISNHPHFPDELVIIGTSHDESLCFSKIDGQIVRYGMKETRRYADFKSFLNETLIRSLRKEL